MNNNQFTNQKEFRALSAMRELYGSLIRDKTELKISQGPLCGKTSFPSKESYHEEVRSETSTLYVAGDKKVVVVNSSGTVNLPLPPHRYEGLYAFRMETVPYITAGYSTGIIIINTQDKVEEKKTIHLNLQNLPHPHSKFKTIGHTGNTLEDAILWAAHSDYGILQVPLCELLRGDLSVKPEDEHILPVGKNDSGPSRLYIAGDKVYASKGSTVYQFDSHRKTFDVIYTLKGERISSLAVKDSAIFAGTMSGKIYQSETLWHDIGNVTATIAKIVPVENDNVLFTTVTNNLYGPLRLAHGAKSISISPSAFASVSDFQVRNGKFFTVEDREIKKYTSPKTKTGTKTLKLNETFDPKMKNLNTIVLEE